MGIGIILPFSVFIICFSSSVTYRISLHMFRESFHNIFFMLSLVFAYLYASEPMMCISDFLPNNLMNGIVLVREWRYTP
jgi:hypothetical protein